MNTPSPACQATRITGMHNHGWLNDFLNKTHMFTSWNALPLLISKLVKKKKTFNRTLGDKIILA
jgi:hypothetical protein